MAKAAKTKRATIKPATRKPAPKAKPKAVARKQAVYNQQYMVAGKDAGFLP